MSMIHFVYDVVKLVLSGVLTGVFLGLIAKSCGWKSRKSVRLDLVCCLLMRLVNSKFLSFTERAKTRKSSTVLLTYSMSIAHFVYDVVILVLAGVLTGVLLGLIAHACGWR